MLVGREGDGRRGRGQWDERETTGGREVSGTGGDGRRGRS